MKRIVALSIVVGLVAMLAASSEARSDRVGGGLKGGLNIATLSGREADAAHAESKTAAILGGYVRIAVGGGFSVQPELLFSGNGAKGDTLGLRGTVTVNYLELPVFLRYGFKTGGKVTPGIFLGPAVSARISSRAESMSGRSMSLEDMVKPFDYALVLGADMGVLLGRPELTLEVRYKIGLATIDDTDQEAEMRNRVLSILVGFYFGPGGRRR